ncbi:hypothetical protein RRG08_011728 [Elysia crispata]|uniref:Uncharacterized protein n=1 Tax=Elysia crispata TaxID=231223 RepID=A0AAE1AF00_9GAST|nr:hypothetical protein RRG08_011728 [Elysia crispata]
MLSLLIFLDGPNGSSPVGATEGHPRGRPRSVWERGGLLSIKRRLSWSRTGHQTVNGTSSNQQHGRGVQLCLLPAYPTMDTYISDVRFSTVSTDWDSESKILRSPRPGKRDKQNSNRKEAAKEASGGSPIIKRSTTWKADRLSERMVAGEPGTEDEVDS